jgi:hypothetical protein
MVKGMALPGVWKLEIELINKGMKHAEDFVYVGGVAVSVLYAERATKDIDVVARNISDSTLIGFFEKVGWKYDKDRSNSDRLIFWKELVKGYENALEVWNNCILEKRFDELVWERKIEGDITVTEGVKAKVPTLCVEDMLASKIGHEGIQRDDRIDVINLLNRYWDTLDYDYLKERLKRWELYGLFAPELRQCIYLPGLKRMIDFNTERVIARLG